MLIYMDSTQQIEMEKFIKILVSDADKPFCDVLCKVLSKEGYGVTCIPAFQEALGYLKKEKFMFVIFNLTNPQPENLVILQSIFENASKAKVIVTTNFQDEEFSQKIKSRGAIACFMKPFKREQILNTIALSLK